MSNVTTEIAVWEPNQPVDLAHATTPSEIAVHAKALSDRDIKSIEKAFENKSYEMVSTFIWTRAITGLKKQIASLGMEFVGEMLGRPDIHESSDPKTAISELDAIALAEDLGMITATEALRLKHALDLVSHFSDSENAAQDQMNPEEAMAILRACVASILGNPHIKPPIEFAQLREALESESILQSDLRISQIADSPYFFQRTALSVLLSLLKTAKGAQLEHAVGNTNVILPRIWSNLRKPERWQVGQTYAEVYASGKQVAAIGLKNALSMVKGFDYVPETLRSETFSSTAHKVLEAHYSYDNFYKEAAPMSELASLGSTIPKPAFPICMTATLAVRLGNYYGVARSAQQYANSLLSSLRIQQWEYYLNECLGADKAILDILENDKPAERWIALSKDFDLRSMQILNHVIVEIVSADTISALRKAKRKIRLSR